MMKLIVAIGCLAVAGCASIGKTMDTWMGVHVDNLVAQWGPPQSDYALSDGGRVLQYSKSGGMTMPGIVTNTPQTTYHRGTASAYGSSGYAQGNYSGTSTTYTQSQGPATYIALSCTINVSVDAAGIITSWNAQGNNC